MAYQSRYMREKYGESDNSFKEYVSRVQQAIDKAPEAQPQWLQNKKRKRQYSQLPRMPRQILWI